MSKKIQLSIFNNGKVIIQEVLYQCDDTDMESLNLLHQRVCDSLTEKIPFWATTSDRGKLTVPYTVLEHSVILIYLTD